MKRKLENKKMIDISNCKEYFEEVVSFAKEKEIYFNGENSLEERLDYLNSYADHEKKGLTKCLLYKDHAPLSFSFRMMKKDQNGEYKYWFNGGLIFHGNHDGFGSGEGPSFAVTLNPTSGWSIHT